MSTSTTRGVTTLSNRQTEPANKTLLQVDLPCEPPAGMGPLFDLLNSFVEIAFIAGVAVATLGFLYAGIRFMMPGQDNNRLAKKAARNTLIGAVLLLGANIIVSFLISQLGTATCT